MKRPKLLDLFCCQGGASAGYASAGFEVVGVDREAQPRYPFEFHRGDAVEFLAEHGHEFDAIAASPPCQAFTAAQSIRGNEHPELIEPVRDVLRKLGKPFVIENVEGAPLHDPVLLCGTMFGLRTYRHRLFESNVRLTARPHFEHVKFAAKMGRRAGPGEYMTIVGNFTDAEAAREIMAMPWATRDGLREAIPPAYTEHLGRQLLAHMRGEPAPPDADLPGGWLQYDLLGGLL